MGKFEFDTRIVTLEICGKKYDVNYDNTTRELCKNIQKKAGEMAKMTCANENSVSDDEVCKFFLDSIDKILGKGSSTAIFMGRRKNYLDAARLFNFIIRELNADCLKDLNVMG